MSAPNYNGILTDLVNGNFLYPLNKTLLSIPIKDIQILPSTEGYEIDLINKTHPNEKIILISDENTREVLGKRLFTNLSKKMNIKEYVWKNPICSIEGVKKIQEVSRDFSVLIAVGSGSINDTIKYSTFLDKKKFSVFATSPMNAYTSPTASVSFNGLKKSIYSHPATSVYFDMSVISKSPQKLIKSAFSDVICRTTSQFDWILSHEILNTPYNEIPYYLLNFYEKDLFANAKKIKDDIKSLALLTKVAAIMGLSTFFTGTTHYGSMAEHGISHFIDTFAKESHPGTSHGEQVGLATLTISKIQNSIVNLKNAPLLFPTIIPEKSIINYFGSSTLDLAKKEMKNKILNKEMADKLNIYLDTNWEKIVSKLKSIMISYDDLWNIMGNYGAIRTVEDANLDKNFYNNAVRYSRFMRDRYTVLDFVGDSNQIDKYIN